MARKSLPGKEVVVVSSDDDEEDDDANIIKYIKPVSLYKDLETRLKNNPYFLRRCLNYIIRAKRKKKSNSGGTIRFNYRDVRNKRTLKAEDVENFSCPFCLMRCGGHEGLRLHLKSSHDAFKYDFYRAEEDHGPEVDVYLKRDTSSFWVATNLVPYATFKVLENDPQLNPFMFRSKHRKGRKQRDDSDSLKRLNARFLELDLDELLPRGTETESTHVNNDTNVSSPPRAHSSEKTSDNLTTTQQPAVAESSEPKVLPVSRRKNSIAERSKAKGLRLERLKTRQFYHSHTMQPMTFEEVMSNEDSENETDDDDALDLEERLRFERITDLSEEEKRYMYLWNIFVRKQRVLADRHVPWACEEFTKLHKEEMKTSSSFDWWWRMFRITLWDRGLICAKTFNNCTTIFLNSDEAGPSTSHGPANANSQQSNMEVDP